MTAGTHLSDAQFTEMLSGTEAPEVLHHVQGCARCGAELERVRSAVESFNGLSLAWAQRESLGMEVPSRSRRRLPVSAWSMAGGLAAVLTVAGLAVGVHVERSQGGAATTMEVATAPTEAAVAEDNRLLAAIDGELRRPDTAMLPVEELGAGQSRPKQGAARRAAD